MDPFSLLDIWLNPRSRVLNIKTAHEKGFWSFSNHLVNSKFSPDPSLVEFYAEDKVGKNDVHFTKN